MEDRFISILRCPVTGQDLHLGADGVLRTADGTREYAVNDGIFDFLGGVDAADSPLQEEKAIVKNFYENYGWEKNTDGVYKDSLAFVALSEVAREYTRKCNLRVGKHLRAGGRFLLDAGSGAIPWPEYLQYHEKFDVRICVDLSRAALLEAKRKLGPRGRYVLADITNLPFKDGAIDAAVSSHVIYHVPANEQPRAFTELARVLAPGGRAAVVYSWPDSALEWRFCRVMDLISAGAADQSRTKAEATPQLYFHPHPLQWFRSQRWPFKYQIVSFRLLSNGTMKKYFRNTFLWRSVVKGLLLAQQVLPGFCGRYGKYPVIVLQPRTDSQR